MDMFPGWAKRLAELQIVAYKKQFKLENYYVVRPCNIYGPGDNFDPNNAMVIPSLLYRIFNKESPVKIWGDGSAIRDFAYSEDVADGIILTMIKGTGNFDFLNLGSGKGYKIKELVETMASFIDFKYEFDSSKDSGFKVRVMDISNAKSIIGYNPQTTLRQGLEKTWKWFLKNNEITKLRHNYLK